MSPVNGRVSHWFDEVPSPRPPLPGDRDADVCIVGAGYTGLWTAYYLKRADPSLRITILEARFAAVARRVGVRPPPWPSAAPASARCAWRWRPSGR